MPGKMGNIYRTSLGLKVSSGCATMSEVGALPSSAEPGSLVRVRCLSALSEAGEEWLVVSKLERGEQWMSVLPSPGLLTRYLKSLGMCMPWELGFQVRLPHLPISLCSLTSACLVGKQSGSS